MTSREENLEDFII